MTRPCMTHPGTQPHRGHCISDQDAAFRVGCVRYPDRRLVGVEAIHDETVERAVSHLRRAEKPDDPGISDRTTGTNSILG